MRASLLDVENAGNCFHSGYSTTRDEDKALGVARLETKVNAEIMEELGYLRLQHWQRKKSEHHRQRRWETAKSPLTKGVGMRPFLLYSKTTAEHNSIIMPKRYGDKGHP